MTETHAHFAERTVTRGNDMGVLQVDPRQFNGCFRIGDIGIEAVAIDDDGLQVLLCDGQRCLSFLDGGLRLKQGAVSRIGRTLRGHTARQQGLDALCIGFGHLKCCLGAGNLCLPRLDRRFSRTLALF